MRRTKIVATMGPASSDPAVITRMIRAGMDVARLNFSHGTHAEHRRVIERIRAASKRAGRPVGLLLDLQGPRLRVGEFSSGKVEVESGDEVTVTSRRALGNARRIPIAYSNLMRDVTVGDRILIADGLVELRVIGRSKEGLRCRVITGGELSDHKGVNFPGVRLSTPSITPKDRADIEFGISMGVDGIALSFVRQAHDLVGLRRLLRSAQRPPAVIAKIERREAIENLDSILDAADCVMIARGDLGVEFPPERVPILQKRIIERANQREVLVITATQMLESMVHATRPTRAEVADVANAIFDGTDAVMLSQETAVGRHPVLAVEMMASIARTVERELPYGRWLAERGPQANNQYHAIAFGAVGAVYQLGLKCIVSPTNTGTTVKLISAYRPAAPVVALSPSRDVVRQCQLLWGVHPRLNTEPLQTLDLMDKCADAAREMGLAGVGDKIGITAGLPAGTSGGTNLFKVHTIE